MAQPRRACDAMSDPAAINPAPVGFALDRRALARSFDRAAPATTLPRSCSSGCAPSCWNGCGSSRWQPQAILDLGAGTCQGSLALHRSYPRARIVALDIAPGMLNASPRPGWPRRRFERVCADAYALPLAARSIDLVYSNLMLQWCDRPDIVLREVARVLKPGGSVRVRKLRSRYTAGAAPGLGERRPWRPRQPIPRHAATWRGADACRTAASR